MNRLKAWLVDIGLWEMDPKEKWTWSPTRFRPLFWETPTNQVHRAYRDVITNLAVRLHHDIQEAYVQGLKDGALQYSEHLQQEQRPPESRYLH